MRRLGVVVVGVVALVALVAAPIGAAQQKEKKATVRQVASVVAERQPDLLEQIDEVKDQCDGILGCTTIGKINALTLKFGAQTLGIVLKGIDNRSPKNRTYIGTIPKELRALVKRTKAAAAEVVTDGDALSACATAGGLTSTCKTEAADLGFSSSRLRTVLQAWSPYI